MKSLLVAEKPSVAREIAKALGVPRNKSKQGFFEGPAHIITWAFGHLVAIAPPDAHNPEWKSWKLSGLPMLPDRFQLQPTKDGAQQFKLITKLLQRDDVGEVVCATDAGREGELIFRRIYWLSGSHKPVKRLWASDLTQAGLKKALANIRPGADFDNLAAAALARSEADWLVGMNLSRLFSLLCNDAISQGRVQTPVLKMIVDRRLEIDTFVPQDYWLVQGNFQVADGEFPSTHFLPEQYNDSKHWQQDEAQAVKAKCESKTGTVLSAAKKAGQQKAPLPFDLTTLQRECNRKFGFSAKKTLGIAQALYEQHTIITYPRTDSRYLSSDVFAEIGKHLAAVQGIYPDLVQTVEGLIAQGGPFACVNDKKVTDHHAIIPTQTAPKPQALSLDEKKVFDLIARRFMASFMPPLKYESTTVWIEIHGERFKATGRIIKARGWLEAEPWRKAKDTHLPEIVTGEQVVNLDLEVVPKKTTPPQEYTDESLLGIMETAGKQVSDPELRAAMKDKGLGTPATRAQIIETLIQRGYVQRSKKKLVATDKGIEVARLSEQLIPDIVSPEMTGAWEQKLEHIARGQAGYSDFRAEISKFVSDIVAGTRDKTVSYNGGQGTQAANAQHQSLGTCPLCGGEVVENSKAFGCSNWKSKGCKFAIWKNAFGGKIGKQAAKQLLTKGQTSRELSLKSKAGKKYKARLAMDPSGKMQPVFKEQTKNQQ